MADWRTAALPDKVRATLAFLDRMTLQPKELGADDAASLKAGGVSHAEAADAAVVGFTFNIYDRCSDALGWKADYSPDEYTRLVKSGIAKFGYMFPGWTMKVVPTTRPPLVAGLAADVGPYVDMLAASVLDGPGRLDRAKRQAIFERGDLPPEARAFLDKVWDHAYRTLDDEVAALKTSGWSEDQIFEAIVTAAVGAARVRLESAMRAIAPLDAGPRV